MSHDTVFSNTVYKQSNWKRYQENWKQNVLFVWESKHFELIMKMIRKNVFELKGLTGDQLIYLLDNGASLSMLIDEGADLEAKHKYGY